MAVPTMSGTPAIGQTLTCSGASFSGPVGSITYQWLRGGYVHTGAADASANYQPEFIDYDHPAVGQSYTVTAADSHYALACQAVASNVAGSMHTYGVSGAQTVMPDPALPPSVTYGPTPPPDGATTPEPYGSVGCQSPAGDWGPGFGGANYGGRISGVAWYVNGVLVSTNPQYVVSPSDVGKGLSCSESGEWQAGAVGYFPGLPYSAPVTVTSPPVTVSACYQNQFPYCAPPAVGEGTDDSTASTVASGQLGSITGGLLTTHATRDAANPDEVNISVSATLDLSAPTQVKVVSSYCYSLEYEACEDIQHMQTFSVAAGHQSITWSDSAVAPQAVNDVSVSLFDLSASGPSAFTGNGFLPNP